VAGNDPQSDGIRAKQLLDDELLQRMFAQAEDSIVDALAAITIKQMGDHTALITLVTQLQAARALPMMLRDAVVTGKNAGKAPPAVA